MNHSQLLEKHLAQFNALDKHFSVLDLACGSGRNGLYLVEQGIDVIFADVKESALKQVKAVLSTSESNNGVSDDNFWQVDFEQAESFPLTGKSFSAIIVFRYLHRPLFEQIKQATISGGIVVYETFTVDQAQFGRPKNPDFLLKHGELAELFADWQILHSFEGVVDANNDAGKQAVAQIVARKP